MKISIILPLYDRQGTGWKSLESTFSQNVPRSSYEVIVIVGGRSEQEAMDDTEARALLSRCDAVVRFPRDLDLVDDRVALCHAGIEASSGEILYFAEGHTVLHPYCCQLIGEHFSANPSSLVAAAPFHEVATTDFSKLISHLKMDRKSRRIETVPLISLGGQTAFKREFFQTLCTFASEGMFSEVDICLFIERNCIEVGEISTSLCDHFSRRSLEWQTGWLIKTGQTHFFHFDQTNSRSAYADAVGGWKRKILSCAHHKWCAALLFPLSYSSGVLLFHAALILFRLNGPALLYLNAYLSGYRLLVLAGFCHARLLQRRRG